MIAALLLLLATAWPAPLRGSTTRVYDSLRIVVFYDSSMDSQTVQCCYRVDTLITYTGVPCPHPGWSAYVTQYREEQ